MKPNEQDKVESLLRDFFADELGEPPSPIAWTHRRWIHLAGVAACALFLLWLVAELASDEQEPPSYVEEYLVIKDDEFLGQEVYSTPDGAMAQSASLEWTTVSMNDPASGHRLDLAVPQLVIRVESVAGEGTRRQRQR
jgi:hypothetical protein